MMALIGKRILNLLSFHNCPSAAIGAFILNPGVVLTDNEGNAISFRDGKFPVIIDPFLCKQLRSVPVDFSPFSPKLCFDL
jgi:hypothetical protein